MSQIVKKNINRTKKAQMKYPRFFIEVIFSIIHFC